MICSLMICDHIFVTTVTLIWNMDLMQGFLKFLSTRVTPALLNHSILCVASFVKGTYLLR